MITDFNNKMFQKEDYANIVNTLKENDISTVTRETTKYVQQERENEITEEKMYV